MTIQELQYWRFQPFRRRFCIWRVPCKLFEYMAEELVSGTTAFKKNLNISFQQQRNQMYFSQLQDIFPVIQML